MYKLNIIEKEVRQQLIDLSRSQSDSTIAYQKLSDTCGLKLCLSKGPHSDQTKMSKILESIALYEWNNGRSPLTALIVREKDGLQGKQFFNLCQRLEMRQTEESLYPALKDDRRFSNAMIYKCRKYWQNEDNYKAYYDLPDSEIES